MTAAIDFLENTSKIKNGEGVNNHFKNRSNGSDSN